MKRCILLSIFLVTLLPTTAVATDKKLSLTGSSTIAPMVSEFARRFEASYPEYRIDVQTGGSSRGIADTRRGLADIGMSSRALFEEEKVGLQTHILAIDGVAFVVHKDNPVTNLSKVDSKKLLKGEIKNWKQLGGRDAPITVINRAQGRSEHSLIQSFLGIKAHEIRADVVAGENQQCVKLVSGNKNSITYLSVGTAEFEVTQGAPLKLLSLDKIAASVMTVKSGEYPIVRPLLLITKSDPREEVVSFLKYSLSSEVNDLIKELAFVPSS